MNSTTTSDTFDVKAARRKSVKKFLKILFQRKIVIVCTVLLAVFILSAVFAGVLAPYDPDDAVMRESNQGMSAAHWLGTDNLGRDTFSRILFGGRVSLLVGVLATLFAAVLGSFIGMITAFFGGWVDMVIMRLCEAMMSIPNIVLAMALISVFGTGVLNLTLILGISSVPVFVRMMRAETLKIRQSDFIKCNETQGARSVYTMIKHILPNAISPIIVMMTQMVGAMILMESGLSFIGIGVSIPTASWGTMISDSKTFLASNPVQAISPGVCIALLVICLNEIGDGVRDALDPRLRGEL